MLTAVMTGPAIADHKGTCHGPGCGDTGEVRGIGALLDDNGDIIGSVVGISARNDRHPTVSILFEMSDHMFLAEVISGLAAELSGFKLNTTVWFSERDCEGTTWVTPETEEVVVFFGEFRAALISGTEPDERRLFHVIPGTDISMDVPVKSRMKAACTNDDNPQDLFSATELDSDLHVTFPKPYSLDLN